MKKICSVVLCMVLVVLLTACGNEKPESSLPTNDGVTTQREKTTSSDLIYSYSVKDDGTIALNYYMG